MFSICSIAHLFVGYDGFETFETIGRQNKRFGQNLVKHEDTSGAAEKRFYLQKTQILHRRAGFAYLV